MHKKNFDGQRKEVLERDGYECQLCGNADKIIVHHIDKNKKNNSQKNLVTLCRRCHLDIHRLGKPKARGVAASLLIYPGTKKNTREKALMSGWIPLRKKLLEEAGNKCELCNRNKNLIVHHKDDQGLRSVSPNNKRDNLIVLCRPCHSAITNQRNNSNRQLAARYVLALGAGVLATPTEGYVSLGSVASATKTLTPLAASGKKKIQAGSLTESKRA